LNCAAGIPCIVISADNSAAVRDHVSAAGFRFLPKPVQPARLQALIAALVEKSAAQSGAMPPAATAPGR
jgi:CheY-like chemotaxis protein